MKLTEHILQVGDTVAFRDLDKGLWDIGTVKSLNRYSVELDICYYSEFFEKVVTLYVPRHELVFPVPTCLMDKFYSDVEFGDLENDIKDMENL